MSQLELFVLPWGVYPRRILLYLSEKGLKNSPLIKITEVTVGENGALSAEGKPQGTVPILRLPDGTFIKQSIAILEFFEDVCDNPDPQQPWQVELARGAGESMRGKTAAERAHTREMLALADEAASQFGLACHKGTIMFKDLEETSALAARLVLERCRKTLELVAAYYTERAPLKSEDRVTIADCVLYSLLYFAKELYAVDLAAGTSLNDFYKAFGQRSSAVVGEDHYPLMFRELCHQWI